MTNGITLEELHDHSAVREVHERDRPWCYIKVRPYGNATLFNNLARSSNIRLGNVTTLDDGDVIKANVKPLGE